MVERKIFFWLQRLFSFRRLRWWHGLALITLGLWILMRAWLPGFIRQQVVTTIASLTPAQVALRDIDLNLLRGRIALQDLRLTLPGEDHPILAVRDLAINVRLRSLLRRHLTIEKLSLVGIQLEAIQERDGLLNLTRLLPPAPPEQPPAEPTDLPTLTIQTLQIEESQITYQDRTRPPEPKFALSIRDLTTEAIALQSQGLIIPVVAKLDGLLDRSPLHGEAQISWQRQQTAIDVTVEVSSLPLTSITPYLQDVLTYHTITGQFTTALHYRYTSSDRPSLNALSGTLTVENLQVADSLSQQVALTLPKGKIAIDTVDLLQRDVRIRSAELDDLQLRALHTPTGINLASLWQSTDPESQPNQDAFSSPWQFTLRTIQWTGGEFRYRDSSWPETEETLVMSPETIEIHDLGNTATTHPFRFRTRIGEGTLAGDGTLQLTPFTLQGQLHPDHIDVASFRPVFAALLPGKSFQGKISGSLQVAFNPQATESKFRCAGTLETTQMIAAEISEAGSSVSWEQGHIAIQDGSTLSPLALQFQPQLFQVQVQRPTQTNLSLAHLKGDVLLSQAPTPEGQLQTSLRGTLELAQTVFGSLTMDGLQGSVVLTSTPAAEGQTPVTISGQFTTTQFNFTGVSAPTSTLTWTNGDIVIQEGSTLSPLSLDVDTQLSEISLQQLPQGDVAVKKARATLRIAHGENLQHEPLLHVQGPIDVSEFALTHGPEKKILLGCYRATAKIAEGSHLFPPDVRLLDVALEYTYAQGMRTPTGQLQLVIPTIPAPEVTTVLPAATSPPETAPPPSASLGESPRPGETVAPAPLSPALPEMQSTETVSDLTIRVDRVSLIGGELYFEDHAVSPPQAIYWQDLRVNLKTVSYPFLLPTVFSAAAYNEEGALVEFKGTSEKQGEQTVVRVRGQAQKISLPRFNAYLEPSLGYRVKKGAVTATWDLVLPGDRLQANMKVTLHDIGLGGKRDTSELEQQVGLPLALVIALLKDLNGDIKLQLPVKGRLNEPGFQWGGTLIRVIRDVLLGAVTSPLKLLGAIFKDKEELADFAFQPLQFLPGTNTLTENAHAQLGRLSQFLSQRPELDLRLSGMVGTADLERLEDDAILTQLATAPVQPPPQQPGDSVEGPPDPPPLTPEEEVRRFLTQQLHANDHTPPAPLSEPATVLLEQLRKKTVVSPEAREHLIRERLQKVTDELTTQSTVAATRLHVHSEKQKGPGAAEVRYVIQTRAVDTEEQYETPQPNEKQKKEKP